MIEKILPGEVSTAEAFADPHNTALFPEEAAPEAGGADKRHPAELAWAYGRGDFIGGRKYARSALIRLGVPPDPVLARKRGVPCWPPGIVGSIAHCTGYGAAAVARAQDLVTIGIDAEPNHVLPEGVLEEIAIPPERNRLRELIQAKRGLCWDRLLFGAKESAYKAWSPLTRRPLGFEDADVTIDAADHTFSARLLVPAPAIGGSSLAVLFGRWLATDDLILTAIAVPTGQGSSPGLDEGHWERYHRSL